MDPFEQAAQALAGHMGGGSAPSAPAKLDPIFQSAQDALASHYSDTVKKPPLPSEFEADWGPFTHMVDAALWGHLASTPQEKRARASWASEHPGQAEAADIVGKSILPTLIATTGGVALEGLTGALGAPLVGRLVTGNVGAGAFGRAAGQIIPGALQGGLSASVYPGSGTVRENMLAGALAGPLAHAALAPLASHIAPTVASAAKKIIASGVPLKTAQIPGSPFAARAMARVLSLHDPNDIADLTKQLTASMGSDSPLLNRKATLEAQNDIGDRLNKAASGVGDIADNQLYSDIINVARGAHVGLAGQDAPMKQMVGMLGQIHDAALSGQLNGKVYQNLTQKGSALWNATQRESPIRQYALPVREALDAALARANPQAAADIALARNQWRNSRLLENFENENTGLVDPRKLYNAVKNNYGTVGGASQASKLANNPVDIGTLAQASDFMRQGAGKLNLTSPGVGMSLLGGSILGEHLGLPLMETASEHPVATAGGTALTGLYGLLGAGMNTDLYRNFLLSGVGQQVSKMANPLVPMATNTFNYSGHSSPINSKYSDLFSGAGAKYGIDPTLLSNQAWFESGLDPTARSKAGAAGIAQFMPDTAKRYGVDVTDPASSIEGQAHYMSDLMKQFNGNTGLALAGYNWGENNVARWLARGGNANELPSETRNYVQNITGQPIESWLGGGSIPSAPSAAPVLAPLPQQNQLTGGQ